MFASVYVTANHMDDKILNLAALYVQHYSSIIDHKLLRLHPRCMTELYYPFQACVCYSVIENAKIMCSTGSHNQGAGRPHTTKLHPNQSIGAQISIWK